MISAIVKFIVSIFLSIIAISLFGLWLFFGTLLLITLLIRLVTLYTIALLNTFISGTPLTQNYTAAIEEVIDMYLYTYGKIISMPKLPWIQKFEKSNGNFRALLPTELVEIKKSWAITAVVFVSYILSFGFSLAYLTYRGDSTLEKKFNKEISIVRDSLNNVETINNELKAKLITTCENKIHIINSLHQRKFSINSILEIVKLEPEEVRKLVYMNNLAKYASFGSNYL